MEEEYEEKFLQNFMAHSFHFGSLSVGNDILEQNLFRWLTQNDAVVLAVIESQFVLYSIRWFQNVGWMQR